MHTFRWEIKATNKNAFLDLCEVKLDLNLNLGNIIDFLYFYIF